MFAVAVQLGPRALCKKAFSGSRHYSFFRMMLKRIGL